MLFIGYDPGGEGAHGVAAVEVSASGVLIGEPTCEVVGDARAAWSWLSARSRAAALGIDTLLAWSLSGRRACDEALRRAYPLHSASIIAQNSLYSSMTLNGAMVARRAGRSGLKLFECHPKLFVRTRSVSDPATASIIAACQKKMSSGIPPKKADHMADAVVCAWSAAQGFYDRWRTDLYDLDGDDLDRVADHVGYPWPDEISR